MKDFTQGDIRRHLLAMAVPTFVGMLVQLLYLLVDLYFVSRLGNDAVAGVSAAGNASLIVIALTQVLSVGTVAIISQAVGAKQHDRAESAFNQSFLLSLICTAVVLAGGMLGAHAYMGVLAATPAIADQGATYLYWYLPGFALQFPMAAAGAALRATGVVKPIMTVQLVSVLVNIALAPVLVAGWGTGHPLGVAGAGLASTLSVIVGAAFVLIYFLRHETYVRLHAGQMRPRFPTIRALLKIGVPSGGEYGLLFLVTLVTFAVIRHFGADAQAGFGIGTRLLQSLLMPAMAIGVAVPAVVGQNFGAGHADRVRRTLVDALLLEAVVMVAMVALCHVAPGVPVSWYTSDAATSQVAVDFLRVISWNFFSAGITFACSGLFQGVGRTTLSLIGSVVRVGTFVACALALSQQASFTLTDVWHVSVLASALQAATSLLLVRRLLRSGGGARAAAQADPVV
jgi:putative MATE family efflux protein